MKPIQDDRRQSKKQDVFSLGLSLIPVSLRQPNIELNGPPPFRMGSIEKTGGGSASNGRLGDMFVNPAK
jgi:hypothetical protein